ncbi:MFS transporter [Sporosarcina sp. G11-34]|uniref:MFS transporter n=1 Tax=Sporosarcina sp. G11-34 TaxID=2849605 RepID=UPI0022A9A16C|nr:MFS transporter [Sporosarcina sp. G11-34]MCZ2257824.1 MFS transporter [Sporosarcina sp. G11-34]
MVVVEAELEKTDTSEEISSSVKKAVVGAAIGNLIEWFDYASYGYLAVVIAAVFFAPGNETAALLGAFGVFSVSFIVRPIGGLIWGHFGDKIGRKRVLVMTISIMSLSTFAIGFLPSYAAIGIMAPLLLLVCRLIQGFSASGEYAGAASFISEYAPNSRRGLLVSMVPASTAAGLMLAVIIVSLLEFNLTQEALYSWGWRIPFLLSGPLGIIGLLIRLKLEDTPLFKEMDSSKKTPKQNMFQGVHQNRKQITIAFGIICLNAVGFYTILSYMPTYLTKELGFSITTGILITLVSLGTYVLILPLVGMLADRIGRKPVLIGASIMFILFTYPAFWLLSVGGAYAVLALIMLGFVLAGNDGVLATFLTEMFPTSIRFSAFALSFNTGNAIFGGTAPLIATFLIAKTGNTFAPAFYLMAAAIVAFIFLLMTKETANQPLKED